MAALPDKKREAFAQALASGMTPEEATREVKYGNRDRERIRARAARADVIARVAEIPRERALALADLAPVIERLIAAADVAAKQDSAAALVAMKGLLAEAGRLKGLVPKPPPAPAAPRRRLSETEWLALYAPPKPGSAP